MITPPLAHEQGKEQVRSPEDKLWGRVVKPRLQKCVRKRHTFLNGIKK